MTIKQIMLSTLIFAFTGNITVAKTETNPLLIEFMCFRDNKPHVFKMNLTNTSSLIASVPVSQSEFDKTLIVALAQDNTGKFGIIVGNLTLNDVLNTIEQKQRTFSMMDILFIKKNVNCVYFPKAARKVEKDELIDMIFVNTTNINECIQFFTDLEKSQTEKA